MLSETEAKTRLNALQNAAEKRVNTLLLNLGFRAVDFNAKILNDNRQEIGEIDSLFLFDNHLLIIEITNETNLETDRIISWFSKWSDNVNINKIFSKYGLSQRQTHRIFFWLSKERPNRLPHNIARVLQDHSNKIVFLDEVKRYEENYAIVGTWERNNFLNFLEIKRPVTQRPIPAVLFYVSEKPAYAFSLSAKELLEISFISRRYKNESGFQRAINKKRIEKIRKAIERKEILAFPNSILINSLSTLLRDKPPRHECPKNVEINLPQDYSSCKVIDGQHRLLGFSKVSDELARSYNLPIVAFENLTEREEIDAFVIINSEQKKVDTNLVLLLKSDLDWPRNSEFYLQKIAVDIVKKLNERSCLARKIYMGYADQERAGTWVTLATLVRAIILNKFIGTDALFQSDIQDTETPYNKIREIFDTMKQCNFPYFIDSSEKFFLTNRGLRILFRFIYLFHRNAMANNISIQFNEALNILSGTINAQLKKELEDYYGEGGAKKAVERLVEMLRQYHAEFRNFQCDLRRL